MKYAGVKILKIGLHLVKIWIKFAVYFFGPPCTSTVRNSSSFLWYVFSHATYNESSMTKVLRLRLYLTHCLVLTLFCSLVTSLFPSLRATCSACSSLTAMSLSSASRRCLPTSLFLWASSARRSSAITRFSSPCTRDDRQDDVHF